MNFIKDKRGRFINLDKVTYMERGVYETPEYKFNFFRLYGLFEGDLEAFIEIRDDDPAFEKIKSLA